MGLYASYARPRRLEQASALIESLSAGAVVIAGGQELMPSINSGALRPDVYVDIGDLNELKGIEYDEEDGLLSIGALTVHSELQSNSTVKRYAPLLAQSVSEAGGGRQVHNRGTIGGNIAAMHPLYDITPSLLAMNASLEILKDGTLATRPLSELLDDPRHGLGSNAIIVRVLVSPNTGPVGFGYNKLKMSGGAYGSANAAALVTLDGDQFSMVRLIVGAVAEKPIDCSVATARLLGETWSDALAAQLKADVSELVKLPMQDLHGPPAWRKAMAGVVAARAVSEALETAIASKQIGESE